MRRRCRIAIHNRPFPLTIPLQTLIKEAMGAYRELENDMIEVTATGTGTDGSPVSLKGTFPRQGGGTIAPEGMSYVVTVIDPYIFYLTILQNGKQVLMYRSTISKDGNTKRDQFKGMDTNGKAYEGVELR